MLLRRVIVGAVGIPATLVLVWLGGWPFAGLILAAALLGLREFAVLVEAAGGKGNWPLACAGAVAVILAAMLGGAPGMAAALAGSLLALLAWPVMAGDLEGPARAAFGFLGVAYVAFLGGFFVALREGPSGLGLTLFTLGCTWAFDTAGFFVGGAVGRHRLAPGISPGKTVEGLLGGVAGALAAALGLVRLLGLPAGFAPAGGLAVAVAAQAGDLAESMLKRFAGAKDSGTLLPGHGGVLDRLDSLLFAAPVVYGLVRWWSL